MATATLRAGLVIAAVVLGVFVLSRAIPTAGEPPAAPPAEEESPPAAEDGGEEGEPAEQPSPPARRARNPSRVSLQVLNGTDVSGLAADTQARLEEEGYKVVTIGDASGSYETTTLFTKPRATADAERLIERFFQGAMIGDTAPDADVDITVVLGEDYAAARDEGQNG